MKSSTSIGDPVFVKQKAPEIFESALSSALELPELKMASAHLKARMAVFQKWSAAVKDNNMFADRLVSLVVKQVFSPAMLKAKSLDTKYEKMWAGYHELMIGNEFGVAPSSVWKTLSISSSSCS